MISETFALFLILLLAAITALFYFASGGNITAIAILFSVWTALCISLGYVLNMIATGKMLRNQSDQFLMNAKENMALIQQQQRVQNLQIQSAQRSLLDGNRLQLAQPAQEQDFFEIDQDIFADLD